MGQLLEGKWVEDAVAKSVLEEKNMKNENFNDWITKDGNFKAEKGRYHLYVSYGCPWASRALLMRNLKGLEDVISLSVVNPYLGENGWSFDDGEGIIKDPIINAQYLRELYVLANPKFTGRVTVPVLWDKKTNTIVNNNSGDLMKIFNFEFNEVGANNLDFRPANLTEKIEKLNEKIEENICKGVYGVGYAKTQEKYEEAIKKLYFTLDELENILENKKYLLGDNLTETDIKLFPTLVRFDSVYVGLFKCSKKRIVDYPNLWRYLKEIYNIPEVKKTVNFNHIKKLYYGNIKINPNGIIPVGPDLDWGL